MYEVGSGSIRKCNGFEKYSKDERRYGTFLIQHIYALFLTKKVIEIKTNLKCVMPYVCLLPTPADK